MDQLRSSGETERLKRRVSMFTFTIFLDASILNAYVLSNKLIKKAGDGGIKWREIKRRIAESLIKLRVEKRDRHSSTRSPRKENDECVNLSQHYLIERDDRKWVRCWLCSARGMEKRINIACVLCGFHFHFNCYAATHHPDDIALTHPEIY